MVLRQRVWRVEQFLQDGGVVVAQLGPDPALLPLGEALQDELLLNSTRDDHVVVALAVYEDVVTESTTEHKRVRTLAAPAYRVTTLAATAHRVTTLAALAHRVTTLAALACCIVIQAQRDRPRLPTRKSDCLPALAGDGLGRCLHQV